jgi:outer membrane immunogenic protein
MRRFVFALGASAALSFGLAQIASAADLRVKAPPRAPVVAAPTWTGCYIGANVGGGFARTSIDDPDGFFAAESHFGGGFAVLGGQLGCNYQWRAVVVGIEGDYDWANFKKDDLLRAFDAPSPVNVEIKAIASVRGRLGLAFDNALIYVTAGPAWGKTSFFAAFPDQGFWSNDAAGSQPA